MKVAGDRLGNNFHRLESIQVLRAVAAIGVVFTHAITRLARTFPGEISHSLFVYGPGGQLTVGDAGVDLFFDISGFIMFYVHREEFGQRGAQLGFITRRVLRIVPTYWLLTTSTVVLIIVAPQLFTTNYAAVDVPWILGSYFFLPIAAPGREMSPVVGVGWTLNYEMLFYIIFACALTLPRRLGLVFLYLLLGSMVVLGTIVKPSSSWLRFATNWLLLDFLAGVAIAWWVVTKGSLTREASRILLSIGCIALGSTVLWTPPEEGPIRFLLWGAPAALIVFAISSVNLPDGKISRLACLLGDASYSIYLFQFFALPMWARTMWNFGAAQIPFDVNLLILTSLVVITGLAGWFVIERPLGKMMRMVLKTQLSRFRPSREVLDG
jgi:exopolysaccharide production protein ExoZ